MAMIVAVQTFMEDRTRFDEGRLFEVDDGLAAYFVRNGWAEFVDEDVQAAASPQSVTLEIQSPVHDTRSFWAKARDGVMGRG